MALVKHSKSPKNTKKVLFKYSSGCAVVWSWMNTKLPMKEPLETHYYLHDYIPKFLIAWPVAYKYLREA
jgi:hypothetical protein